MTKQIVILTTILFITSACSLHSSDSLKTAPNAVVDDTAVTIKDTIPVPDNLKIASHFAEDFLPGTTLEDGIKKMHNFPDSVVKAFKALRSDRQNQEKYLTLLFLKIYRGHLQCCHQSYDLRAKSNGTGIDSIADPLLFEYNLITKQFDNYVLIEFISSGIAADWLEKNKKLLSFDPIKKEYKIIKKIQKNIENGIYW